MRVQALAPLIRAILPMVALGLIPIGARAQTGTLQPPAKSQPETPPQPPNAAPRTPVKQPGPPVVQPQAGAHAQKPSAQPVKPAPPPPPAPAVTPAPAPPPTVKPAITAGTGPEVEPPKLPRYQSLRSNEVNLRAGPGTRYRIEWVYKRMDFPVLVEREYEHWRLVRDPDGIQGWINQATLTSRRHFIIKGKDAKLLREPKESASPVAILNPDVIGRIKSCAEGADWCQVQVAGHTGYLRRNQFWGTLPGEEIK